MAEVETKKTNEVEIKTKNNNKEQTVQLISEFFATALITFLLCILAAVYINNKDLFYWVTFGWATQNPNTTLQNIMVVILVIFIIGITIVIFDRWSCNANPTIALYLYAMKKSTGKFTTYKIIAEFLGGMFAGLLALLLAMATNGIYVNGVVNSLGGYLAANIASFGNGGTLGQFFSAQATSFFVEFLAGLGIGLALFSKSVQSDRTRYTFLLLIFGLGIGSAFPAGVTGFNPARSFGPALFHDVYSLIHNYKLTIYNSELISYWAYIVSPFLAVWLFKKFVTSWNEKIAPKMKKVIWNIK